ncbi:MAG: NYN domain-containing protein, partial [Cyanobacteria bacterium HKST-UBA05]|nr:NYN domain-containing protein [Cyanobacteria bacterium HKST-UBA05]
KRTNVYIDGFNLYYGAQKSFPDCKWLNLLLLCRNLLPGNDIQVIKYFTARVKALPSDLDAPKRQDTYFRALSTVPEIEIHEGFFQTKKRMMPVVMPEEQETPSFQGKRKFKEVWDTKEKGSDVNLATHLIADAFMDKFDVGVVISNDSDLVRPIHFARKLAKKRIGVFKTQGNRGREIMKFASFSKTITRQDLLNAQFQNPLTDPKTGREIHKPLSWN